MNDDFLEDFVYLLWFTIIVILFHFKFIVTAWVWLIVLIFKGLAIMISSVTKDE